MIAPRSSRLMAKINWPIPPPVCLADLAWWYAGHVVLSGHIEQLLVQQEELFDAARGGVHVSLRPRFDKQVRDINAALRNPAA